MKIDIIWEIEDGYAGGSRPHYLKVDTEDYGDWESMEEKEKSEIIEDEVQNDFNNSISWYISSQEDN